MMTSHWLKARLFSIAASLLLIAPGHAGVKTRFEVRHRSLLRQDTSTIDSLLALRDLSFDEVMKRYSFTPTDIEKDAAYEKLGHVTAVGNKTSSLPYFFFRKDKLVMIYFTTEALRAKNLTADDFVKRYGKRNVRLRSRAGKSHHQLVYPAEGFAFSTDGATLDFLEIFPTTTKAAYLNEIYRKVAPFIK